MMMMMMPECVAVMLKGVRQQQSVKRRKIIHIQKKKKKKRAGLCTQTNTINSFYLRDKKTAPLAEIHVNYKPSLSQHSCQCQINVKPLRSLWPPFPNNTTSIDS